MMRIPVHATALSSVFSRLFLKCLFILASISFAWKRRSVLHVFITHLSCAVVTKRYVECARCPVLFTAWPVMNAKFGSPARDVGRARALAQHSEHETAVSACSQATS